MKIIYFKGLNEIRALAALAVLWHHVELYKRREGTQTLLNTPMKTFIDHLGANGVAVFFVLSGFLITYLLLVEKERFSKIDLKKFYLRRILRIWPLYYFIVFLSFAVLPFVAQNWKPMQQETSYYVLILESTRTDAPLLLLFLLFLPNVALRFYNPVVGASQSWSVGVEEQFYILWPQLLQRLSKKMLLPVFIFIAAIYPYCDRLARLISPEWEKSVKVITSLLPINFMATGAIAALLLHNCPKKIRIVLHNPICFIFNTCLLIGFLFFPVNKVVFSFVVALQILFIVQEHFKFNLRNRWISKIGDLSYGVYMYHPMVMFTVFSLVHHVLPIEKNTPEYQFVVYFGVIALTLCISHLSYVYFEKKFIAFKNKKFTVVGSNANGQHL